MNKLAANAQLFSERGPSPISELDAYYALSTDLLCTSGEDGHFKNMNSAFLQVLGYSREDLFSRPFIEFVHPDDKERTMQEFVRLINGKSTIHLENRYLCKNGEYKHLRWRSFPIAKDGLLYSAATDITEEMKRNQELNRLNKLLVATQSYSNIGGWEIDLPTKKLIWTKETYLIHKTTPKEYSPEIDTAFGFYTEETRPLIQHAINEAILYGKSFSLDLEILSKDSDRTFINIMGYPVQVNGLTAKLDGVVQDITESKRNTILMNEQKQKLVTSAKMSSLGEMAAGIAHEINNPLAIIAGGAIIIKSILSDHDIKDPILSDQIEAIIKTTKRIGKIVKGLQSFSRNSSHDPFQKVNLRKIIEDTLAFCHERFKKYSVDVKLRISEANSIQVFCHPAEISQVLLNLLNNSYDAISGIEDKWIELLVKTEKTKVIIKVMNSGPKIPKEIAEKIMEPFFTTKAVGKGTGLGLSISQGIIQEHQGLIYLDRESPYTTFIIELPFNHMNSGKEGKGV